MHLDALALTLVFLLHGLVGFDAGAALSADQGTSCVAVTTGSTQLSIVSNIFCCALDCRSSVF